MNDRVSAWLDSLGLAHYREAFAQHAITWDVLPELTDEDLTSLGVLLGHRKKLRRAITELVQQGDSGHATAQPTPTAYPFPPPVSGRELAERRQLTVMFCDLVGSTALASRLDPEEVQPIIRKFLETCSHAVTRFHGYIAKYMGDGLLAYFGYPQAHEHDAERAIHAGLAVLELVKTLPRDGVPGQDIAVRIGIATGQVLVGELIGTDTAQERSVFGETPNLTARLQSLAAPNQVIIDATTRSLVGNEFACADCGAVELKGFDQPIQAWQVVGRHVSASRFESYRSGRQTDFIGRESELALLLTRWREAVEGEGRVVLLSGEAGIGKSKLVWRLGEQLRDERHYIITLQCSPHHTKTALYPVINHLRRVIGVTGEDRPATQWQKLETFAATSGLHDPLTVTLLGDLLTIAGGDQRPPVMLSPDKRKELMLEALVQLLQSRAVQCPTLCIVEDVHWIDPTSMELLTRAIVAIQRIPALLVITARPDFNPTWSELNQVMVLTLSRLSRRQSAELLVSTAGGKALPLEVEQMILAKTEGVPLYVEELTDSVIKSRLLIEEPQAFRLQAPLKDFTIPDSLQALLTERIDRLGLAKEIAQIGAALGREFGYELLRELVDVAERELEDGLQALCASGLMAQEGEIPLAKYVFRHALIQDAAYGILAKAARRTLHLRIAQTLETKFIERTAREPELLAHHYEQAAQIGQAIKYWFLAAQRDATRSVHIEALHHFDQALHLLAHVPQDSARNALELDLLIVRGRTVISLRGGGADEIECNYRRAKELSQENPDSVQHFFATWGLWIFHLVRGQLATAGVLAKDLLALSQLQQKQDLLVRAHSCMGWTSFFFGRFDEAKSHLLTTVSLHDSHKFSFTQDAGVSARTILARTQWILGKVDQVESLVQEAVGMARELGHPFTLAFTLTAASEVHVTLRDAYHALRFAEEAIAVSTKYSFEGPFAWATSCQGWALFEMGNEEEGLRGILKGIAAAREAKAGIDATHTLSVLADVYLRKQQIEEGLGVIEEALALVHSRGEVYWHAELIRLKGELLLAQSDHLLAGAEQCFLEAMEIAQRQHALMLELRAATSLTKLLKKQNKLDLARRTLSSVYSRFGQHGANPDLTDARVLLESVS
jgi:class 3 adenylate cyclase/predicted ATPase